VLGVGSLPLEGGAAGTVAGALAAVAAVGLVLALARR
jgi:hypothetical protein